MGTSIVQVLANSSAHSWHSQNSRAAHHPAALLLHSPALLTHSSTAQPNTTVHKTVSGLRVRKQPYPKGTAYPKVSGIANSDISPGILGECKCM